MKKVEKESLEEKKLKKFPQSKKIIIKLFALIAVVAVLFITFLVIRNKDAKVDNEFLLTQLEKSSELTSAKVKMTGIYAFKDSGFLIFNKGNFIMVYEATVRSGIDIKEVKVDTNNSFKKISVTIPSAKVQSVEIDPNSIKYYNEKMSLFNFDKKEDANKAMAEAKKDAEKKAETIGLIELADEHSETLIRGILQPLIPKGYKIDIKR